MVFSCKNEELHIRTPITSCGDLIFDHCIIHYGEEDELVGIEPDGDFSVEMNDCTIIGHSISSNVESFISSNTVKLRNCELINCGNFIGNAKETKLSNCIILNPGHRFIASDWDVQEAVIENCLFIDRNTPDFILESRNDGSVIFPEKLTLNQCTVFGYMETSISDEENEEEVQYFGSLFCADIFDVSGCIFQRCSKLLGERGSWNGPMEAEWSFDDCRFDNCTKAVNVSSTNKKKLKITRCQFNHCYRNIVHCDQADIYLCEFNHWQGKYSESEIRFHSAQAMIECYHGSDQTNLFIEDCVFNAAKAHHDFLVRGKIDGYATDEHFVTLTNCSFNHCQTNYPGNQLIQMFDSKYGLLGKEKQYQTVEEFSCSVNMQVPDIVCKETDRFSESIGCTQNMRCGASEIQYNVATLID